MLYFEKNKNAQKIRENLVADQKSAYVIYEWSLRPHMPRPARKNTIVGIQIKVFAIQLLLKGVKNKRLNMKMLPLVMAVMTLL